MSSSNHNRFPRLPLFAVGGVIGFTLLAVALVRISGIDTSQVPADAVALETRELRFVDNADGAVLVRRVPDDRVVKILEPGTNSFIRGVLRSINRERRRQNIDIYEPYRLTRWDDGRLSLHDPTTGELVDLGAFGKTQLDAFTVLLIAHRD